MRSRIATLLVLLSALLTACTATSTEEVDGDVAAEQDALSDAEQIAAELNAEADASTDPARQAVRVTYAERVPHHRADGGVHYGVHYVVMIATDAGSDLKTRSIAEHVAGRLFQMTTEQMFSADSSITHMGVQVIDADFWIIGGHVRGEVTAYIAVREDLERVQGQTISSPESFLRVATRNRLDGQGWKP